MQVYEQIGDIQGKAASLHQMAQVFLTRGDLDRALALYQESLQLKEQIGDIKGKAASLSMMANVYWQQRSWKPQNRWFSKRLIKRLLVIPWISNRQ